MVMKQARLGETPNGATCLSFHTTADIIFAAAENANFAAFKIEGQELTLIEA